MKSVFSPSCATEIKSLPTRRELELNFLPEQFRLCDALTIGLFKELIKSRSAGLQVLRYAFDGDPVSSQFFRDHTSRIRSGKGIDNQIPFVGEHPHEEFRQNCRKSSRMHLKAEFLAAHCIRVIRIMSGLYSFRTDKLLAFGQGVFESHQTYSTESRTRTRLTVTHSAGAGIFAGLYQKHSLA